MRMSQVGDRVLVHFVKRYADGAVRSSPDAAPLGVTVGTRHPRLPGLWGELVGLKAGDTARFTVPADRAFGATDPTRVVCVSRTRFAAEATLTPGRPARMRLSGGRSRRVRVIEVRAKDVLVDANHPRCGQALDLEVRLVAFEASTAPAN
ncbi:FKBP-type peptidyl-prolyl cis-trans isomerase [Urbifossiella limnaea]|uniref:Peptidyl-prolyl cis-trans isomerase n=1 Tax=Urbifossiella limnaea TaxID=2528023 RepID=A0A517XQE1_9BACT|nr:FKBP-type peptidyl-prolyl cis-trans isomerase [Urbifossiella limnaea]QDU19723.1 FKBP-type 16 kDa peptidyl-prolyl cis-trans isomerase [Urbifossiella limnaea]